MVARHAVAVVTLLSFSPALAKNLDAEAARRFIVGKLFAFTCGDESAEHGIVPLGGEDNTSAAERSIVRRASVLTVELERMEAAFALAGEASPEAIDLYARCAANLRRLLESVSVGLERRQRDVSPSLDQYLARKAEAAE